MSFVQRLINLTFTLANGAFQESGTDTVTISGLRTSVKITKAGFPQIGQAQITIYGLTLSLMNQLSTFGVLIQLVKRNSVTVYAGDAINGMSIAFIGDVMMAWGDFSSSPEVPFHIEAQTAMALSVLPKAPASYNGSADVVTILSGLAQASSMNFENNGVSGVKISFPYYWGSPRDQIESIRKAVKNQVTIEIVDNAVSSAPSSNTYTLAIWPKKGSRGGAVPLISPTSGLIGYPSYTQLGIVAKTIYNPSVIYGGKVQIQSTINQGANVQQQSEASPVNGTWTVFGLDHDLESMVPNGRWDSSMQLWNPKYPLPVPQ
jgi:hypothetical protein